MQPENQSAFRINLGCGSDVRSGGFINVDIEPGENIVQAELYQYLIELPDNTVDEIVLQDILEHFPHGIKEIGDDLKYAPASQTSLTVLEAANNKLKPGGLLVVRVPDLEYIMQKALSGEWNWDRTVWALFGGQASKYDFHHTGWTGYKLNEVLQDMDFVDIQVSKVAPNIEATARKPS